MEIFLVEAGWDYDGVAEVGVYLDQALAEAAYEAKVEECCRPWGPSYDYVRVVGPIPAGKQLRFDEANDHTGLIWAR